jgi:hypothetical protein
MMPNFLSLSSLTQQGVGDRLTSSASLNLLIFPFCCTAHKMRMSMASKAVFFMLAFSFTNTQVNQ